MLYDNFLLGTTFQAYIAGNADGIVTVADKPAMREIIVFDTSNLSVVIRAVSLANGHYMLTGLNPTKTYLIMARDYERQYEPFCYDYVKPATDLTLDQQQALCLSWQT